MTCSKLVIQFNYGLQTINNYYVNSKRTYGEK